MYCVQYEVTMFFAIISLDSSYCCSGS